MNARYVTIKGSNKLSSDPYYIGLVQYERTMTKREAYQHAALKTGFTATQVRAVFMALREYLRENAARGNITHIDGVASIRNLVKGAFETMNGPWVKGRNYLLVAATEMDPFKSIVSDAALVNNTEGAKPVIYTVFDETSREYGVITGTNVFSIAGADLAPDTTKPDEGVFAVNAAGVETKCTVTFSDLQNVKAALPEALEPGEYTLKVYTRSGLGAEYGVGVATRKVVIG